MSDNITTQSGTLATVPPSTVIETIDQGVGVQRQVVQVKGALPAGTNLLGKAGIDQTTPGTTNKVSVGTLTEKWIAGSGQGLTWGNAFTGSTLNSLASTNALISDLQLDNSSAFDIYADVSVLLASFTSGAGAPYVGIYFYPLLDDGTTYGDGRFGSAAVGPPPSTYFVGAIPVVPSVTQVQSGAVLGIILPPGKGKLLLYNLCGGNWAASGNTCKYRSYDRSWS